MTIEIPNTTTCDFCGNGMQFLDERTNKKGEVIQRTFVCHCEGKLRYKNFHHFSTEPSFEIPRQVEGERRT